MRPASALQIADVPGHRDRQCGIALVIVLWVTALLAVIAAGYAQSTRTETLLARHALESAQARASAEAGLRIALVRLMNSDASNPTAWRGDGSVHEAAFHGSRLRISIVDEGGKMDLNTAPGDLLDGLLASVGLEDEKRKLLRDAILDWRDEDQLRRLDGAEDAEYAAAGLPYGPGNGRFGSVEELALVLGMTPELYRRLEGALTVHSGEAGIQPANAPRQVLLAVPGIDATEAEHYLQLRQHHAGLAPSPPSSLPRRYVSMRNTSRIYSVYVEAHTPSGAIERLAVLVKPTGLAEQGEGRYLMLLARKEAADLPFPSLEPGR